MNFAKLGPYIKSCHAKEILQHDKLSVYLDEMRAGVDMLDDLIFLGEIAQLAPAMPLILEHLPSTIFGFYNE